MKVNIITIHDPDVNYGSTLQSCGTYNFVKRLGYDAQIIDYRPNYKSTKQRIKIALTKLLFHKANTVRRKKIDRYFKKHAAFTQRYNTHEELFNNPPVADVYITGSDVIWNRDINPEGADSSFYLGFVKNGKKISYAPSMGEIQREENISFIKKQIMDFDFISVREEKSKEQLISAGLENVKCVMDPVFLMDREYYEKQLKPNMFEDYTLVYLMSFTEEKKRCVKDFSGIYADKVISFGGFKQKCECDEFIRDAGVEDFLTLIYNAKHIITDSFHCIAFCLIFNKQFIYLPSIDSSMRIENILTYAGLKNRIFDIKKECDLKEYTDYKIDYDAVNELLGPKINYSRMELKKELEKCSKGAFNGK